MTKTRLRKRREASQKPLQKKREIGYTPLMPKNQKQTFVAPANPSAPGTPEWLYNEIMRHIEPDLLTDVLSTHVEIYKDETHEERIERMKAYDEAFIIFDKAAAEFEHALHQDLRGVRAKSQHEARKREKKEQNKGLEDIESQLDTAA